ncbi:GSCOCG00006757001-RA-CDS [Cotesia congregata]|uniref:Similar to Ribonuclease Oy (Crassostrea gigas) n=1 Tax=Cotesia congregata TaxID=51543 RepID=A0A8J2MXJ0_COTCN|nr:GSCOCG00006757001-RA-CDS [Cotesia congregata]CAG5103589.1 Similar to Ribonuclease Oy (Crassostrea gigas) [Cotesia congregata]
MDTKKLILMLLVIIVAVSVEGRNKKKKKKKKECTKLTANSNATINFDYLVLTISWLPTACYVFQKASSKSSCKNLFMHNKWSIHGLWPTMIAGESPESCNCSTKFNHNETKTLTSELNAKWTNIERKEGEHFWQHEYEKHGSCASSIEALNTQYKYFDQGLKLFEKYNISQILNNSSINVGSSYREADIVEGFRKQLGKQIIVRCKNDSKMKKYFLYSIQLCFDKSLSLTDCIANRNYPSQCPPPLSSKKIEFSGFRELLNN